MRVDKGSMQQYSMFLLSGQSVYEVTNISPVLVLHEKSEVNRSHLLYLREPHDPPHARLHVERSFVSKF